MTNSIRQINFKSVFFNFLLLGLIVLFSQCNNKGTSTTEKKVEDPTPATETNDNVALSFNNGTKVVRGVNICPLTAQKIADGNNPKVGKNEPLTDLSVNASNTLSYAELGAHLPNAHYAFSTLGDLRKGNKHLQIVQDPLPGNPYHCLISVITPNEMASTRIGGNCR